MMEKSNSATDKYKINKDTVVTVKNTHIKDNLFKVEITLKHRVIQEEALSFVNPDELSDFINNIDMEDKQTSLALPE